MVSRRGFLKAFAALVASSSIPILTGAAPATFFPTPTKSLTSLIDDGKWHQITHVVDNGLVTIYVDRSKVFYGAADGQAVKDFTELVALPVYRNPPNAYSMSVNIKLGDSTLMSNICVEQTPQLAAVV